MTSPNGTGGGATGPGAARSGTGGPPPALFLIGLGGVLLGALVVLAQLLGAGSGGGGGATAGPGGSGASVPPDGLATPAPAGEAAARTRSTIATALSAKGLQVTDPQTPYRPGESPALLTVPRRVVQVVLPDEPTGGYIVIYELDSAAQADAAGREFRGYLASGTGAIQYPRDTEFVLRRVDTTLVFFPWSPEASTDERVPLIADALGTVGQGISGG